jgi:hypothetical protein
MDEAVIAAAFRRNEAIAFVGIEEFYFADGHDVSLSKGARIVRARMRPEPEARKGRVCSEASVSVACDDSQPDMDAAAKKINDDPN